MMYESVDNKVREVQLLFSTKEDPNKLTKSKFTSFYSIYDIS